MSNKKNKRKNPAAARAKQRIAVAAAEAKKQKKKRRLKLWPIAAACSAAVVALGVFAGYRLWLLQQPKFHDVTVELGTDNIGISDFMTEYAEVSRSRFVTDPADLDIGKVGETEVTLSHGGREETVILRVEDTVAPRVTFVDELERSAGFEPQPEDFVESIDDESATRVFFETEPDLTDCYSDIEVKVIVEDASGNRTDEVCRVVRNWMVTEFTMELGGTVAKSDLLLDPEYGSELITDEDIDGINGMKIGTMTLSKNAGGKTSECLVTVRDTTPPEVVFETELSIPGRDIPEAKVFVSSVSDLSATTIYYREEPARADNDEDITVEVVVEDEGGNKTSETCLITRAWMRREFKLELGRKITADDLLTDPRYGEEYISADELEAINNSPAGTYTVHGVAGDQEIECRVYVVDTVAPTLVLKDRTIYKGKTVGAWDFVQTAYDISGSVTVSFAQEPSYKNAGTYTVEIKATDVNGNSTAGSASLYVIEDKDPPSISGLSNMSVKKHSSPDYLGGVSAWDANDGSVRVTYDASKVDIDSYGTYYITYTAADKAGNTATARRQIYVQPDTEDTAKIVKNIAASLPADAEALRDYVRDRIAYNHDWGGDDPVYYGFMYGVGNCYVHAYCLKALLDAKGITDNMICHVLEGYEPHYWNIVRINGVYRHVDSTPGTSHTKYSLMTDAQRYETLKGRDWDRSAYPKCE